MSKTKTPRAFADTEAKAVLRMLRVSPQKLNLLDQLIRGKRVGAALADLEFSQKRISGDVKKALESAIANAENNPSLDVDDLVVVQAHVGKAMVMKRFSPRARGRAGRLSFCGLTRSMRATAWASLSARARGVAVFDMVRPFSPSCRRRNGCERSASARTRRTCGRSFPR